MSAAVILVARDRKLLVFLVFFWKERFQLLVVSVHKKVHKRKIHIDLYFLKNSARWYFIRSYICVTSVHYYESIIWCRHSVMETLTALLVSYSGADQRNHQSSASLAFVWGIHRWPVNYPHKWPLTQTLFPFDGVIMLSLVWNTYAGKPITLHWARSIDKHIA